MSLISSVNFVKNMLGGVWYIELEKLEPRAEKTSNSEMVFFLSLSLFKGFASTIGPFPPG